MNPELDVILAQTDRAMSAETSSDGAYRGPVHVGVDLGTAYSVLMVLDEQYRPLAGAYQFAQVVRDGLVVDFEGATSLLRGLKRQVEERLGFELTSAATAFPPGVPMAEVRATGYVFNAAGLDCSGYIDEPSAANNVLQIRDGVIVDVGGGTTGIAIVENGQVVYTADEATGGTHFSLVIAGAKNVSFEQAENNENRSRPAGLSLSGGAPCDGKSGFHHSPPSGRTHCGYDLYGGRKFRLSGNGAGCAGLHGYQNLCSWQTLVCNSPGSCNV